MPVAAGQKRAKTRESELSHPEEVVFLYVHIARQTQASHHQESQLVGELFDNHEQEPISKSRPEIGKTFFQLSERVDNKIRERLSHTLFEL